MECIVPQFKWYTRIAYFPDRPGLDGNAARLVLGFSGSSTKFPDGPQPDSHNPRFRKPPLSSRTVGSPESGWRHSISSETLPMLPEAQVLAHIHP
jgi:hypothetical protein